MDRCLRSRSASTARDEDAASVISNSEAQEGNSENELERNATNVDTDVPKGVEFCSNSNVTSGIDDSPVSPIQLHNMLSAFMKTMQAENTKLASNLEAKLNTLAEKLDAKLAAVSESLDTKLNLVSGSLMQN
jgi:hypothetical protein